MVWYFLVRVWYGMVCYGMLGYWLKVVFGICFMHPGLQDKGLTLKRKVRPILGMRGPSCRICNCQSDNSEFNWQCGNIEKEVRG